MFPKNLRIADPKVLARVREFPCCICAKSPVDAAHIKSKGAGGDDTFDNLLPLCRDHHQEQHRIGFFAMADKYHTLRANMVRRGWGFTYNKKIIKL